MLVGRRRGGGHFLVAAAACCHRGGGGGGGGGSHPFVRTRFSGPRDERWNLCSPKLDWGCSSDIELRGEGEKRWVVRAHIIIPVIRTGRRRGKKEGSLFLFSSQLNLLSRDIPNTKMMWLLY